MSLVHRSHSASLPEFSEPGGHHVHPLELILSSSNLSASIRYTLDGSAPSSNSARYKSPLVLVDRSMQSNVISMIPGTATVNQHTDGWKPPKGLVPKASVVRAQVFENDLPSGPSLTQTYFAGRNPMQVYGIPVVSITLSTNELFNYETGIYMLGRIFDDYVKAHPKEPLTGHTPANYTQRGPAWERPGYLEWFEPDGTRALAQGVLIDVQGQSSRSFRQKSLGLKSLADGVSPDDFRYEFFPGLTNRQGGLMTRFDHLRLGNSGNDWAYTMLRDALCHVLARSSRIDTLAYRPVAVYLDGEFWGVHNLREQQDADYIAGHYGVPQSEVVICESAGSLVEGSPGDETHFLNMRQFIETQDMTRATNYAAVMGMMDVENFIAYQAAEIYFANADWPHNNIRFWRRRTSTYEAAAPYGHDGRWRWLLFDVDLGYGHAWTTGVSENSLAYAMAPAGRLGGAPNWSTAIFRRLLLNPGFRDQFINTMADLLNSSFRETRATNLVQQLQAIIAPAMVDHIPRWRMVNDSTNGWRGEVNTLRFFASQRPINVKQQIVSEFHLPGFANLSLDMEPRGAGEFQLNTLRINERTEGTFPTNVYPWRGTYFRTVPVRLEAIARPGYRFVGWKGLPQLTGSPILSFALNGPSNVVAQFERHLEPHDLQSAPFVFQSWPRAAPAGSYPTHMLFEQTQQADPGLDTPLTSEWTLPYGYTSRSRISGLDASGVGFLNTSDPQSGSGGGFVGSAVVALRTIGVSNVVVSWMSGTLATNEQTYALRLQYAVGDELFSDVVDSLGRPVEYVRHPLAGDEQVLGPTRLPVLANNQPYVRVRWKYYRVAPGKGARAYLRLDDILVTSQSTPTAPRIVESRLQAGNTFELRYETLPRLRFGLESSRDLKEWRALDVTTVSDLDGKGSILVSRSTAGGAEFFRMEGRDNDSH